MPETRIRGARDVANLPLKRAQGRTLRIHDIAEVRAAVGPVEIIRENQAKQVTVEADLADGDLGAAVARLKSLLEAVERPPVLVCGHG